MKFVGATSPFFSLTQDYRKPDTVSISIRDRPFAGRRPVRYRNASRSGSLPPRLIAMGALPGVGVPLS